MKALTWQGTGKVFVETVPDPRIQEPTDAIVRMTSTATCGSDLHLYDVLGMHLEAGDTHRPRADGCRRGGGSEVTHHEPGDQVVIPFNILALSPVVGLATTSTSDAGAPGAGTSAVAVRFVGMLTNQDGKSKWRSPTALAPS